MAPTRPRAPRADRPPRVDRPPRPTRSPRSEDKTPRRRRDAVAVRTAILDAAERRLVVAGPAGIRLQEVAADVGVSHPNVLHHFGSRQGLVAAVIHRALEAMHQQLVEALAASTGAPDQLASIFENVSDVLAKQGHGRVILWLALEGVHHDSPTFGNVVDAAHALRRQRVGDKRRVPPREDTAFVVMLATLVLTGSSVLLPTLQKNVGIATDPATGKRFRAWLANLLVEHLDRPR